MAGNVAGQFSRAWAPATKSLEGKRDESDPLLLSIRLVTIGFDKLGRFGRGQRDLSGRDVGRGKRVMDSDISGKSGVNFGTKDNANVRVPAVLVNDVTGLNDAISTEQAGGGSKSLFDHVVAECEVGAAEHAS